MDPDMLLDTIPRDLLPAILERLAMASYAEIEKTIPVTRPFIAELRKRRLGNGDIGELEGVYLELESVGRRDLYILAIRNRPLLRAREVSLILDNVGGYHLPRLIEYVYRYSNKKSWENLQLSDSVDPAWHREQQ